MQCSAMQYNTVAYSTVQYSAMQYSAMQYSAVQWIAVEYKNCSGESKKGDLGDKCSRSAGSADKSGVRTPTGVELGLSVNGPAIVRHFGNQQKKEIYFRCYTVTK